MFLRESAKPTSRTDIEEEEEEDIVAEDKPIARDVFQAQRAIQFSSSTLLSFYEAGPPCLQMRTRPTAKETTLRAGARSRPSRNSVPFVEIARLVTGDIDK